MKKITDFLEESPSLKLFLAGLSFACAALWVLLTIIFTCAGTEPLYEEIGSGLFWALGIYLIVGLIGIGGAIWSEMDI